MTVKEEAMTLTLGHEGGWYDGSDPRDPNPTMWGIIQKTYDNYRDARKLPRQSVRLISIAERNDIYTAYWDGVCDKLPRIMALQVFDMSINAGPKVARQIVQRALDLAEDGLLDGDVKDDGVFGPQTLAALKARCGDQMSTYYVALLVHCERVAFYDDLADNPRLRPNLKSWIGRATDFYKKFLR